MFFLGQLKLLAEILDLCLLFMDVYLELSTCYMTWLVGAQHVHDFYKWIA